MDIPNIAEEYEIDEFERSCDEVEREIIKLQAARDKFFNVNSETSDLEEKLKSYELFRKEYTRVFSFLSNAFGWTREIGNGEHSAKINEFHNTILAMVVAVDNDWTNYNIKKLSSESKKILSKVENDVEKEINALKLENKQFKKLDKKLRKDNKMIENIKNNLFNFFGLIVGLLAFIFVNFQLITSATSLSLGKMIIYMGLANVGLITGITIILIVLSLLLQTEKENKLIEKIKNNKKIIIDSLIGISLSILAVGIGTYFAVDKPENRDIIKRIEKLEGDKSSNNILGVNINGQENKVEIQLNRIKDKIEKLQDENEEKNEKIEMLQNEIEVLQKTSK